MFVLFVDMNIFWKNKEKVMKNVIKNIWIFLVSGWAARRTEKTTQIWAKEHRRW